MKVYHKLVYAEKMCIYKKLDFLDRLRHHDLLIEKFTNNKGEFILDGQIEESTRIDPILKIYHDCSDGLPCDRRWKIALPKSYIINQNEANPLNKTFDMGVFNLEIRHHSERRRCFGG